MPFLPMFADEITKPLDFIFVSGDAYVDHPSFGPAIISRVLERAGFSVGIIAQPNWQNTADFTRLGKPRLGFLVSSGNIDSMVNHYTAAKKHRSTDAYSPGGKAGCRPDRAVIVYCNRIRESFGDIPIILGGLEASLRRFAHYDYWDNRVRRSILLDSRANLLSFGMGEYAILEIAKQLSEDVKVNNITNILGTAYISKTPPENVVILPAYEETRDDKQKYAIATRLMYGLDTKSPENSLFVQKHNDKYLVCNPPAPPLEREELDKVYALPFTRTYHPSYEEQGGVPAIREIEFSLTSSRGCFGGCNFCSITHHQGAYVTSRSHKSLIREAEILTHNKNFKGYIHDVGGPTANFRAPACERTTSGKSKPCTLRRCLFPSPCKHLKVSHSEYLELLRKLRAIPKVKKVFIRSGIRYDYLLQDKNDAFFKELCEHHISGQLKVAPEHYSSAVLNRMGKPSFHNYKKFSDKFYKINEQLGKPQFLVPYLMSSHPGSTLDDAIALAEYLIDNRINPEQVQDFYPTPSCISTCMYYTGIDPRDMSEVYVPRTPHEKALQRALLQPRNPANRKLVREALVKANRLDLIGKFLGGVGKHGKDSRRQETRKQNKTGAKGKGGKRRH
ncbi:UPF0313 protein [Clostridia bacterium]|nr:UPF0313 protein [Clostridia bacterium]